MEAGAGAAAGAAGAGAPAPGIMATATAGGLSFFLVVADYEGTAVDCRVWGDDPTFFAEYCTDVWN